MIVARLNREKLQLLSESRLKEATVLLENQCWTGAYYMTGLAVECALKAYLARAVQLHDFPDKAFIVRAYTHKVRELVQLDAALWEQLQNDLKTDLRLKSNWYTVFDWNDENRYEVVEELQARSLFLAASEQIYGVLEWIRRRW